MDLGGSLGALQERQFRLLWAGQTFSNLGSALVPIALAFAVLDLTGSATHLAWSCSPPDSPRCCWCWPAVSSRTGYPGAGSCSPPT
jgi:hypothetical protein